MAIRVCAVEDCDRAAASRGLCGTHYVRARLGTDLTAPIRPHTRVRVPCSVAECDRVATTRGLCHAHYARLRAGGDLTTPIAKPRRRQHR